MITAEHFIGTLPALHHATVTRHRLRQQIKRHAIVTYHRLRHRGNRVRQRRQQITRRHMQFFVDGAVMPRDQIGIAVFIARFAVDRFKTDRIGAQIRRVCFGQQAGNQT